MFPNMPQSLSCVLLHLIFSTKDRFPILRDEDLLSRTHAYLGGIFREADCPSLTVGSNADHVHAFFQLSRTLQVAKLVEIVKSNSSHWLEISRPPEFRLAARVCLFFRWQIAGRCRCGLHSKSGGTSSPCQLSRRGKGIFQTI